MFIIKRQITQNQCTGCGACFASCPVNAIKMIKSPKGEIKPAVNRKLCIDCNKCTACCPQNNPTAFRYPQKCYVAWSKNDNDLKCSASGGVGVTFSRYVIQKNGIAYGCDYDENSDLLHFSIKSDYDLQRIQSSKYSQSISYNVFEEIKNNLSLNKQVLFIGTPCQVSGLKKYLKKDYPTLITIDLICHGTPPNEYLKEHIYSVAKKADVSKIRFRGEFDQILTLWDKSRIIYQKDRFTDLYFKAFYQNLISRDSCYQCQYAQADRVSDITIGDFWGLKELTSIEKKSDKPSIVLINSKQGQTFFNSVKEFLICEERPVSEGVLGNGRLNYPPGKTLYNYLFQNLYLVLKFEKSLKLTLFFKYLFSKINKDCEIGYDT